MRKYVVEFIGTFFFILCIVLAANLAGAMAPLAIGTMLMVMIYAGGHISGGHFNPAVTLAVFLRGKCDAKDVAPYMIAQLVGAAIAAVLGLYLLANNGGEPSMNKLDNEGMILPALLSEFFGTFALCYVVLNVATAKGTEGNSFYGLAIGFTVLTCAYALGGISGGAFNPAVALGITVAEMSAWSNIWVFLVANFAAGAAAAFAFKFTNGDE